MMSMSGCFINQPGNEAQQAQKMNNIFLPFFRPLNHHFPKQAEYDKSCSVAFSLISWDCQMEIHQRARKVEAEKKSPKATENLLWDINEAENPTRQNN